MTRIAALTFCILLSACGVNLPPHAQSLAVDHGGPSSDLDHMGHMLNTARARFGIDPLARNANLDRAALEHARDMAAGGYISHRSRDGTTPGQRARISGYQYCRIAENIAKGFDDAQSVHEAWMRSENHRKNNLLPEVVEYGFGHAGDVWVLMLGRRC